MTFDEFCSAITEVNPSASFEEDNYGQIVIYTGLMWDISSENGELIPFREDEDE